MTRRPSSALPLALRLALPALPLLGLALGGATTRSTQGVILLVLGALLLWRPPARSPGVGLDGAAAGLVLLAAMPLLLPSRWFPGAGWRVVLTDDLGLALPGTLSPQPWLTTEGIVILLGGVGWLWWVLDVAGTLSNREQRSLARVFVAGAVILAAVSLACYWRGVAPPGWRAHRGFGPFPNRNQTANFLALAGLVALACAHVDFRTGGWVRWLRAGGFLVGLAVLAEAIFVNFSRAGVLILLGGAGVYGACSLWGGLDPQQRGKKGGGLAARAALGVSLLAVLLAGFLVFGGSTLDRFRPGEAGAGSGAVAAVTGDFRWQVQADALRLARAVPWCGLGLGNFGGVFPFFRERSTTTSSRAIHPESDWLWMWTEMGWPAVILAGTGSVFLARRLRGGEPPRSPTEPGGRRGPVRLAALVGLAAFAAHSFVEVSTHRLGTMLTAGFLVALAVPPPGSQTVGKEKPRTGGGGRALGFRVLGAGLAAVGTLWVWAAWKGADWPPGTLAAMNLDDAAQRVAKAGDNAGASARLTQALGFTPLDWRFYLSRAIAGVRGGQPVTAEADFRRARELEPLLAIVPELETQAWLGEQQHPDLALSALEETFRRNPERGERVFRDLVTHPGEDLDFRRGLEALAWREPALWLALLEEISPDMARPRMAYLVETDPELTRFATDPAKLRRALWLWAVKGDAPGLALAMENHPAWQPLAWRAWAEALALGGDARGACGLAARFTRAPILPASLGAGAEGSNPPPTEKPGRDAAAVAEALAGTFTRDPGNLALGLRLLSAQRAAGLASDALVTLAQLGSRPAAPPYFAYLEAQQRGAIGDWPRAWEAWKRFLQATHQGE